MLGVISDAGPKKNKIFHKTSCMYAKRIKLKNRIELTSAQAARLNCCYCKYCAGIRGDFRAHVKKTIPKWEKKYNMKFLYSERYDAIFIRTGVGFWKIFLNKDMQQYLLYHRNAFNPSMSMEQAMHGSFHRQKDMKATEGLSTIVDYIGAHDKAKQIIAQDYRNLPKSTKKQRKYYKQAERKVKTQSTSAQKKRMDSLFSSIEKENEDLKKLSMW